MKNLKDFIKIYDNVLDKDICQKIIKTADKSKFKMSMIGEIGTESHRKSAEVRNCYDKGLDKEFDQVLFNAVGKILGMYENDIGPHFVNGAEGVDTGYCHLLYKGSEKGKYITHVDSFGKQPRLLSISILLNDNFDGGNFCFFDEYIIEKKVGSAIAFPSNFMFPHGVLPVSNGDRHAIITWIR